MNDDTATVLVEKTAGHFKATVGVHTQFGEFATTTARAAAALHFNRPEADIEIEPVSAVLHASVRKGVS